MVVEATPEEIVARLPTALDGSGPAILPLPPEEARASHGGGGFRAPVTVSDEVAVVIRTSGSTSRPKLVALSSQALAASDEATAEALGGAGQWLSALPLHYIAGLQTVARTLHAGARPVITGRSVNAILSAIPGMREPRRYLAVVPRQLAGLLDASRRDADARRALRSLDAVLVGGQALPAAMAALAADMGVRVVAGYGSTETAGGCCYDGRPIGRARVGLVDGRIRIAGPQLAMGYLDPQETERSFVRDTEGVRWWISSDVGEIDASGRLTVRGRVDDVIISGGVKLVLGEVEAVADSVGVRGAVAVRVPRATWGDGFVLFGDGRPCERRPEDAIVKAALVARLGPAAAPLAVMWPAEGLPRLASGKPDRRALAKAAREIAGRCPDGVEDKTRGGRRDDDR